MLRSGQYTATIWRLLALALTVFIFWLSSVLVPKSSATPESVALPPGTKCLGPFNGKTLTQIELNGVIDRHEAYLKNLPAPATGLATDPYAEIKTREREALVTKPGWADSFPASVKGDPKAVSNAGRADLCGVRLTGVTLEKRDLRYLRLMGARLEQVNLSAARLDGADLTGVGLDAVVADGATFRWVKMSQAIIEGGQFKKASFYLSDLHHTEFHGSDLSDAVLEESNLNTARLRAAFLENVDLSRSDVSHASYEARLGHPPRIGTFRSVTGLNSLRSYNDSAASLRELQQLFENAGMRVEAARVRATIVEAKGVGSYWFQPTAMRILYGAPHAYGERAERILLIVALLVPTYALFYLFALRRAGAGTIWLVRDAPLDEPDKKMKGILLRRHNCVPLSIALLFSVRSAFRIGWKDFNVGDWLTRMQQHGYRLEGQGWVRSVAGFQSLISVYLLALLVLSYIGA